MLQIVAERVREWEFFSASATYRGHSPPKRRASSPSISFSFRRARGQPRARAGSFRSAGSGATSLSGASRQAFPRLISSRGLHVLAPVCLAVGSAPGGARGWAPGGPLLRPSRSSGVIPRGFRTRSLPGRLLLGLWWLQSPEHVLVRAADSEASGSQRRWRRRRRAHSASRQE